MSLLVVCCVIQVALAWWLPTLRRIFTPVVTGTVTMLIAVSVLPIAFDSVQDLPISAPRVSGPLIAGTTLLVSVIVALRGRGAWRLVGPFVSILAGCAVAVAFGVVDADRIISAGWFGIPELPDLAFDLTPGREFWALLPSFAILTLVLGIKTISDGIAIQQGSWRRPRAIDFRQIQGMVSVNGIGMLLAGVTSTLPPMSYSSFSLSLIKSHWRCGPPGWHRSGDCSGGAGFLLETCCAPADDPGTRVGGLSDAGHGNALRQRVADHPSRRP